MTSWRELLSGAAEVLGSKVDARRLVEEAAGYDGAEMTLHLDEEATARTGAYFTRMLERRASGVPLQYVLGRWGFRTLDLMLDERVLIPRPETEQVVEWAIEEGRALGRKRVRAVDLGTGSGAIAFSLAVELGAEVWATDVSADAIDVARANLAGIGMFAATRVRLVEGWWWAALPADLKSHVDLVVTNPPYVADGDPLPAEVADHEPALALRAGPDGMDAITEIVTRAGEWLAPGGVLVTELAPHQADRARELATGRGAARAEIRHDLSGRPRALVAAWR